ncbi:MAG: hypothetical protein QOF39_1719 [Frankiales bacterium]|jgi:nitroreductase|nr:hypothetical protein [Frankiales bacterium]
MTDVVTSMVEAANLAPSIHNSQPWQFVVHGELLEVLMDADRTTPAIDPLGRGQHLACGAAAFNALVTARAAGRVCNLALGAQRRRPELAAVLTLGGSITPLPEDRALAAAVPARHTVRSPFEDTPVPAALVDRLRAAVEHEGAWMTVVERPEDIVELAVLTERAEAAETSDQRYQAELLAWMRPDGEPAPDGIPVRGLPVEGPAGRASSVRLRDFRGLGPDPTHPRATEPTEEPPLVERPLLVVIGTDGDHHVDWLRAGMAMQRLWLTATASGLGASPLTQALDHEGPRALLSRIVGLENGHPQMLLRVGFSHAEQVTGRRPVADVLVHQ